MSKNKSIYIFYALISEDKNDGLKIQGPYIHSRPNPGEDVDEELFVFDDDQFKEERKFLSKYLRERNPDKLSIFHKVPINFTHANLSCQCGYRIPVPDKFYKDKWSCPNCGTINKIDNYEDLNFMARKLGMTEAHDYFEKKYDQMFENYTICNRTKRKRK